MQDHYVWLLWFSAFLMPWSIVYWMFPVHRKSMWWSSLFTMPFGQTEPLFVPEYWSPPSFFELASTIGFDIERLIFCFGIGGLGPVLYNVLTGKVPKRVSFDERVHPKHRHQYKALLTPFIIFSMEFIYSSIVGMALCAPVVHLRKNDCLVTHFVTQ